MKIIKGVITEIEGLLDIVMNGEYDYLRTTGLGPAGCKHFTSYGEMVNNQESKYNGSYPWLLFIGGTPATEADYLWLASLDHADLDLCNFDAYSTWNWKPPTYTYGDLGMTGDVRIVRERAGAVCSPGPAYSQTDDTVIFSYSGLSTVLTGLSVQLNAYYPAADPANFVGAANDLGGFSLGLQESDYLIIDYDLILNGIRVFNCEATGTSVTKTAVNVGPICADGTHDCANFYSTFTAPDSGFRQGSTTLQNATFKVNLIL